MRKTDGSGEGNIITVDLNDKQKTAVLLLTLPPELSTPLIAELGAEKVQSVIVEIIKLPTITAEIRESIINEFLVSTLTKKEKAAILVMSLPKKIAGSLFKQMGPAELKVLTGAMAEQEEVPTITRFAVISEFMMPTSEANGAPVEPKGLLYELFENMVKERPAKVAELLLRDWLGGS